MVALILLTTACANPASAPVPAPPEAEASPTPSIEPPEQPTAAPGEQVVPLDCADALPATVERYGMTPSAPGSLGMEKVRAAMQVTAGLLECSFDSGESELSASLWVLAGPPPRWSEDLIEQGGLESGGITEQRYCWGDLADSNHCGVRFAAGDYAAELFLNTGSLSGLVGMSLDGAVIEVRSMLTSLPSPPSRSWEAQVDFAIDQCAELTLAGSPVASDFPWATNPGERLWNDDAPGLYSAALLRTGTFACGWHDPWTEDSAGYDSAQIEVLPDAGWAFPLVATGSPFEIAGADGARVIVLDDERELSARGYALVGDDLVVAEIRDNEIDGLIDDDQADLVGRLLDAAVVELFQLELVG